MGRAYFREMEWETVLARYAAGVESLDRRVLELDDEQLDTFFRAEAGVGRWSCRVLVGHLVDVELVNVHRMRKAVAEEHPVTQQWDEHAFIESGVYGGGDGAGRIPPAPVAGFVAVLHTMRTWHGEWMRGLPGSAVERRMLHHEHGELRVRDVFWITTWHLEHHAWFLARKIERLLG